MKITTKLAIVLMLFFSLYSCAHQTKQLTASEKITAVIIDSLWKDKIEKPNSYWKEKLTEEQFYITRNKGTERPFSHPYNNNKTTGVYVCSSCGNPLYSSNEKFNSGTGWPSFWKEYSSKSIAQEADNSFGMSRNELVCARCGAHLGHVFNDGPKPTGLRHCINGVSLTFIAAPNLKKAVFAQGCFWCVEEIFEAVKGVKEVVSGYAGGTEKNPTYKQVGSGSTSHAEAVEVTYDATIISYEDLLKVYFNAGDITQVNGQGNDRGSQYRSIIFYTSNKQKKQIESYIKKLEKSGNYSKPIAVEVAPFNTFYKAEDYHQNYVKLHPNQGYVKAVSIPRYKSAVKKFPELLKAKGD